MIPLANLFDQLPAPGCDAEQFLELAGQPGFRIERIVSTGQSSPPGSWYDQADGEWVLVVAGEALLHFEDEPEPRHLKAGDFADIAPHRRHRVDWTHPEQPTIWLAVHYSNAPALSQQP